MHRCFLFVPFYTNIKNNFFTQLKPDYGLRSFQKWRDRLLNERDETAMFDLTINVCRVRRAVLEI